MKLTIIGASGHGKVIADIARKCGYDEIEFLDDNESISFCGNYPVVGRTEKAIDTDNDIIVGIGNAEIRKRFIEHLKCRKVVTLVHPDAVIAEDVRIGVGSVIMAGAVVNSSSIIGRGCIINTCSSVDHDCVIDDFVHISVGAHVAGTVNIGEGTWIGAGAIVSNNVDICGKCMIGAGAIVVRDIRKEGTYIGVPAKLKN